MMWSQVCDAATGSFCIHVGVGRWTCVFPVPLSGLGRYDIRTDASGTIASLDSKMQAALVGMEVLAGSFFPLALTHVNKSPTMCSRGRGTITAPGGPVRCGC